MKIDKLDIKNFKFFDEVEALNFESKNILFYGENGSGKSTIYWALYTLLQSSIKDDNKIKEYFTQSTQDTLNEHSLVNIYCKDDESSKIEIISKDTEERYIISKNDITINDTTTIKKSLNTSDFINYKYLFRFFNFLHKDEIDLFDLFEYEILHLIGLKELWQEIVYLEVDKPRVRADKEKYIELQTKLTEFNHKLKNIILKLNATTNKYLKEFAYSNIKLVLSVEDGKYENKIFNKPQIKIKLSVLKDGVYLDIFKPQSYFNEAKLTAIALSVRLAITETKLKDSPLKLLVLDDLLVSLDMSNRDKVLDILLNDDILKEYQKIILTHDKAFFEMAKQKFNYKQKDEWKYFEMYLDIDDETKIEKPLIKTNESYHKKAVEYFKKREYEVASNYLRKEVEKQLYDYLGLNSLETTIDTAKIKDNYKKLEDCFAPLIIILKGFDKCENIPADKKEEKCVAFAQKVKEALIVLENIFKEDSFHNISGIKDRILNPQSHYDNSKPLYKKELEDAIEIIRNLRDKL